MIYVLAAWSMAALGWWLAASLLVRRCRRTTPLAGPRLTACITIFKPLPRLGSAGASPGLQEALRSFVRQLDHDTELLLGLHAEDHPAAQAWLASLQAAGPAGSVRIFFRTGAHTHANAKISWLEQLAPHARGTWWLWSDADMVAPPGWLDQARRAACALPQANLVTFPYYVRRPTHPAGWWDTAFVNAEMLPGACLLVTLRREVKLAFGAAMLFRRETFLNHCAWAELGRYLADDFAVGRSLAHCRVTFPALETLVEESHWWEALRHYQRWHKTIRWCQPAGYACQIVITPLLGWCAAVLLHPAMPVFWAGLLTQYGVEFLAGVLLNRQASGCRPSLPSLMVLATWPALRAAMWIASWLPMGVRWRERSWRGLQEPQP